MATNKLTAKGVERAAKRATACTLPDGEGLSLVVTPQGGKIWYFRWRDGDGKLQRMSLGKFPDVTLADARERRLALRRQIANEIDPRQFRKDAPTSSLTFNQAAEGYIEQLDRFGGRRGAAASFATLQRAKRLKRLCGSLGRLRVDRITKPQIQELINKCTDEGRFEDARRIRQFTRSVLDYAINREGADRLNPAASLAKIKGPKARSHPAIIEPKALGELLRTIDHYTGSPIIRHGLLLLAYLFPRPSELRLGTWDEVDLDSGLWVIPAERTKMRRTHKITLARTPIEIFRSLKDLTGEDKMLMPSPRPHRPLSENAFSVALKGMGVAGDVHTPHGFRATAATLLAEVGKYDGDAIRLALAHEKEQPSDKPYMRQERLEDRRAMMEWWSGFLDGLR